MPFATVTFSEWDAEGFLGIQYDGDGEGGVPTVQVAHSFGFLGRPHDPDEDGLGCTVDVRILGSERFAWIGDDPRSVSWLPRCTKGGSAQYGGKLGHALTWREIDGDTGSITDYVPVEWDSSGTCTKAHKWEVGVDGNGDPVIGATHSEGMFLSLFDGAATLGDATGAAFVSLKDGTITLNGSTKLVGGLDVGGSGGVEVPLHPALAAAASALSTAIGAAMTALSSAAAGSVDPALKAAIPTACSAVSAALIAFSTGVTAGKSTGLKTI